jgi:periplasmic copper chaperone A
MFPFLRPEGAVSLLSSVARRRQLLRGSVGSLLCALPLLVAAHGVSKGDLLIDHPYAVPSAPGESLGKVYFRGIQNSGHHAERLLGASTPQASRVALYRLTPDAQGLQAAPVPAIDLPAKTTVRLRHTGDYQLTLIELKTPLKDGDRFELTLNFEHAGTQTVQVWVQTPRATTASHAEH